MDEKSKHHALESARYAELGASSSKAGVLRAVRQTASPTTFVELHPDPSTPHTHLATLHADGAGTKSIVAYLAYKESNDPSWFRGIAQDSLVMNLDDVACTGCLDGLMLSNTIGRNRRTVPDEVLEQVIQGYGDTMTRLRQCGVEISLTGGETADLGDLVRTIVVDSTLFGRVARSRVVSFTSVQPGDLIVGFSSTGTAIHEDRPNSGIGSNGLTLARQVLVPRTLWERYPEAHDDYTRAPTGPFPFLDPEKSLGSSPAEALLSPTRSYTPLIRAILERVPLSKLHGFVHCTGGGQTKIRRFIPELEIIKDNLFPVPPLFTAIQKHGEVPWPEMYTVFNMGHRLEAIVPEDVAPLLLATGQEHRIEGRIIGRIGHSPGPLRIETPQGSWTYQ